VVSIIGRGNYGTAHLVEDRVSGVEYVIKNIPLLALSEKERGDAESECHVLAKLHHPNIVEYVDSFVEDDALHLVTDFCELGDLSKLIKKKKEKNQAFTEKQIVDWFIQIAMAVDYIHSKNIMHRDLKTGNVFLTKTNVIKLGDFGIAKVLDSTLEQANTVVGTPYYMSPEVCENKKYDKKSDLWAMGCILYELCTLNHAFDASNLLGLVFKIVQESYPPIPDQYSPQLRELVKQLLSKDPSLRPSCRKIFRLPFIKERLMELAKLASLGSVETIPSTPPPHPVVEKSPGMPSPSDILKEKKELAARQWEEELRSVPVGTREHKTNVRRRSEQAYQGGKSEDFLVGAEKTVLIQSPSPLMAKKNMSSGDLLDASVEILEQEISPTKLEESRQRPSHQKTDSTGEWDATIQVGQGVPVMQARLSDSSSKKHRRRQTYHHVNHHYFMGAARNVPKPSAANTASSRERSSTCEDAHSTKHTNYDDRPIRSNGRYSYDGCDWKISSRSNSTSSPDDYYSDDFESDESSGSDSEVRTGQNDAELVLEECKRRSVQQQTRMRGRTSSTLSMASAQSRASRTSSPSSSTKPNGMGPNWQDIARSQEEKLRNALGSGPFKEVYDFLKTVHSQGNQSSSKENQRRLAKLVGKGNLGLCFDMDQLIYIEETYLS